MKNKKYQNIIEKSQKQRQILYPYSLVNKNTHQLKKYPDISTTINLQINEHIIHLHECILHVHTLYMCTLHYQLR